MNTPAGERIDWCHLLPTPPEGWRSLVVLGAPERTGHLLRSAGIAAAVSFDVADLASADAVAVVGDVAIPTGEIVARAPQATAVLVVERHRGRARIAATRALRAGGLGVVERYWPVPDWDHPRRHLPIDHPGAMRWYLDHLLVERTAVARVSGAVLATLARRSPSVLGLVLPTVVFVGTRPTTPSGGVRPLVLTSGNDRWSRTVLCEFAPGDSRPRTVVKVPTEPAGNDVVVAEQESLRRLRDLLSPTMRDTVPEPLGTERRGALVAGRETGITGTSMAVSSGRGDRSAAMGDLAAAVAWARRLVTETQEMHPWHPDRFDDWIVAPAVEHHRLFGHAPRLDALVETLRAAAADLDGTPIAHGWTHGDLGPWNILRRAGGVAVVDWEATAPPAPTHIPPLTDLVYLGTYWLHVAAGHHDAVGHREAARRLWTEVPSPSASVSAVRDALGSAVRESSIPPAVVALAVVHTWLEQANRVARRRTDLGLATPTVGIHADTVVDVLCDDPDGVVAVASAIARA
ncbi:phosphotransferase family protein [Actinospongicola halichondriae]|uniref:phosphotransferase family protein n=1 Tax=Actinospongicola halichondriae TaxID=3236844 RepID=UPI003D4AC488